MLPAWKESPVHRQRFVMVRDEHGRDRTSSGQTGLQVTLSSEPRKKKNLVFLFCFVCFLLTTLREEKERVSRCRIRIDLVSQY